MKSHNNTEKRASCNNKIPRNLMAPGDFVAAELGFEPRQTAPEAVVLPLHNSASKKKALPSAGKSADE